MIEEGASLSNSLTEINIIQSKVVQDVERIDRIVNEYEAGITRASNARQFG
jgi:hypothetical protein